MAGIKEMVLGMIKLTDEVKRLHNDIEKLDSTVNDVDKRVVRIETLIEVSQYQALTKIQQKD